MGYVYVIENVQNKKKYIGSTVNADRRRREHFGELKRGVHHSAKMQSDYDKFGADAFKFEVIEGCEDSMMAEREELYIDMYDTCEHGYNSRPTAYGGNIAEYSTGRFGELNPFYGKKHSEETKQHLKEKWDETRNLRIGFTHSAETKRKMSEKATRSNNSNARKVKQCNLNGDLIKEWDCVADAAEYYNMKSHTSISNCCARNEKAGEAKYTAKGFIWTYSEPKRKRVV